MIGLTQSLAIWYATRGSGAVALVLLTIALATGTPTVLNWASPRVPRVVTQLFHRNVSLLAVVFVGVHVATTVIDGFAPIGWLDAIIPFRSGYRPIWLGLGAVAVDVLAAVIISSIARVRIGYGTWRSIHLMTYALWPIALVHALGTGSDTRKPWMWVLAGSCAVLVLAAVLWRLAAKRLSTQRSRTVAYLSLAMVPTIIAIWLVAGPLRPTWGHTSHHQSTTATTVEVPGT